MVSDNIVVIHELKFYQRWLIKFLFIPNNFLGTSKYYEWVKQLEKLYVLKNLCVVAEFLKQNSKN